jgi:hypothetical protein
MMSTRWGCCDCTPSEAEGLHPERSRGVPHSEPSVAPRAEPSAPRAKPWGWCICIGFLVSTSLDEQFERSRALHPERSRGVPHSEPSVAPRAKPRGWCICIGFLVSASLDEQFASRVYPERSPGQYPERSRGVEVYALDFSSRLRSTNSLSMRGIYCKNNAPHFCEALDYFVMSLSWRISSGTR